MHRLYVQPVCVCGSYMHALLFVSVSLCELDFCVCMFRCVDARICIYVCIYMYVQNALKGPQTAVC